MSREMGSKLNEDFINDFCTYDFTRIIHNNDSSDKSDIEINLELTEKEYDKEKVEASATLVDDEVTSKLLRQNMSCIVIGND